LLLSTKIRGDYLKIIKIKCNALNLRDFKVIFVLLGGRGGIKLYYNGNPIQNQRTVIL